jgi:6-phosphogluconolactonase
VNKKSILGILVFLVVCVLFFSSCQENSFGPQTGTNDVSNSPSSPKLVFVQTNQAAGNEVLVYTRLANGDLSLFGTYSTQGTGTGSGLGSQGALAFTRGGTILLVVNAGSNDISVFSVRGSNIQFLSKTASGGTMPISITAQGNLVYVLNAGGSGNITGFNFISKSTLTPISNSTKFLSNNGIGSAPGPAQISFNPGGNILIVTEKPTNKILSYTVGAGGVASGPNIFSSAGNTPFGFSFRNENQFMVSEAFGGAMDSSAVSSYFVDYDGTVSLIDGPVFTTETAACWVVVTKNNKYTYTTNTGSGTITGYSIDYEGNLTLLNSDGVTANLGAGTSPIDMALSTNSQYLYCLNAGTHTISSLRVNGNGSLTPINLSAVSGLPAGTAGILAK